MYIPYFVLAVLAFFILLIISPIRFNDKNKSSSYNLILFSKIGDSSVLIVLLMILLLAFVLQISNESLRALLMILLIVLARKVGVSS